MYRYLVCRLDAIRPAGTLRSSEHFPMVVSMVDHPGDPEVVLEKALDSIRDGYRPNYEYIIVPLSDAKIVKVVPPQPRYEYLVKDF